MTLFLPFKITSLPPPEGYVFTCVCLPVFLFALLFVCLFVCRQVVRRQDISNSIAPIFMKVYDFVEGLACITQGPILFGNWMEFLFEKF